VFFFLGVRLLKATRPDPVRFQLTLDRVSPDWQRDNDGRVA
jgi:hypothetical protein